MTHEGMPQRAAAVAVAAIILLCQTSHAEGWVAYLGQIDGYWQAFVVSVDGHDDRQLTHDPVDKTRLSWFPDGQSLLANAADGSLGRVSLTGEAPMRLGWNARGTLDAVLSPGGDRIAYSVSPAGARDQNEIFVANLDGSERRKLTRMAALQDQPAWSPDGAWIYFLSGGGGSPDLDVWRVAADGGTTEAITAGNGFHLDAAPAADGQVAMSSNRFGNYEILVRSPSGQVRRLTHDPALDGAPSWSPDGSELVFESTRGGRQGLWRVASDGGSPRGLPTRVPARRPVWGPGEGTRP